MGRSRSEHSRLPIIAEAVLFLLFGALLIRLYLLPQSDSASGIRWWTWLAVGAPFFLAVMVEWRRKKRPVLSRAELLQARVESVAAEAEHHSRSE